MARTEIGKYLVIDMRVCGGRLIFKGSRILVSDAIELSQAGYTPEQIATQYNNIITPEAVEEAQAVATSPTFAADSSFLNSSASS